MKDDEYAGLTEKAEQIESSTDVEARGHDNVVKYPPGGKDHKPGRSKPPQSSPSADGCDDDLSPVEERYIWVETIERFYDTKRGTLVSSRALDAKLINRYGTKKSEPRASMAFFRSPDRRIVQGVGWLPVEEQVIEMHGIRYVNSFRGWGISPVPGEPTEWLSLMRHIFGAYAELIIDHIAFSLQHPTKKIRWQVLGSGVPRTGKTLAFRPIIKIFGAAGRSVDGRDLGAWDDIYVGTKLLLVEEVWAPENRAFFEGIKSRLVNDSIEMLNRKGSSHVAQQNLYSIILLTNHPDSLHFNADEDKLLIVETAKTPWGDKDRFAEYVDAVDEGDLTGRVMHHLLHRDVSQFSHGVLPERTAMANLMSLEGKPDYQKALIEHAETDQQPFNNEFMLLDEVKTWLWGKGYRKYGDKGIGEALRAAGFESYRGRRDISGGTVSTPTFWTRATELADMGPADWHRWYEAKFRERQMLSDLFTQQEYPEASR